MISIDTRLPRAAAEKLIALQDQAHASLDAAKAARFRMTQTKADDPAMALLEKRATDENAAGEEMLALTNNCVQWIKSQPDSVTFELAPARGVTLNPGESAQDAISRLRARSGELRVQLFEATNAPAPLATQKQLIKQHVKELAARGAPRLTVTRDRAEAQFADPRRDFGFTEGYMASVMAWLWPDRLIEQMESMLQAQRGALSDVERTRKMAELNAEIDALARDEEQIILDAAAQGQAIGRWVYSSPPAVLGVRAVEKQAVAA